MCKIYNRPIEIYAYRTQPLVRHQSKNGISGPPIRLSYHFQSHYQSVINQSTHLSTCLTSMLHPHSSSQYAIVNNTKLFILFVVGYLLFE
jgi:hypothetical protein